MNEAIESRKKSRGFMPGIGVLLVMLAVVTSSYMYFLLQSERAGKGQAEEEVLSENEEKIVRMMREVGELIMLPEEERPAMVEVTDKNEIDSNNEFFAKAENGDIVLIYREAKKAYLYRPSEKKLINVSAVTIEDEGGEQGGGSQIDKLTNETVLVNTASSSPSASSQ